MSSKSKAHAYSLSDFQEALAEESLVNIEWLRSMARYGVPSQVRGAVWGLLLGVSKPDKCMLRNLVLLVCHFLRFDLPFPPVPLRQRKSRSSPSSFRPNTVHWCKRARSVLLPLPPLPPSPALCLSHSLAAATKIKVSRAGRRPTNTTRVTAHTT